MARARQMAGGVAAAVDGRINAILVKDARQAVQSRLVTGVILLLVLVNALITAVALVSVDYGMDISPGASLFRFLYSLMLVSTCIIIPLYTSVRFSVERNNSNMDLLYITTITPGSIVRGKWLAASALTLLVFSASAPFIMLSYLLRGIDVATIAFLMVLGLLLSWFLNLAGIAVGCPRSNLLGRLVLTLGLVIVIIWLTFGLLGTMMAVPFMRLMGPMTWDVLAGIGSFALGVGMLAGLIYMFARAMLSPQSSNRMMPLRVSLMIVWLATLIMTVLWVNYHEDSFFVEFWLVPWVLVFSMAMVVGSGEREYWLPRVRRHIPQRWLGRLGFYIISTGSGSGVIWSLIMGVATLAISTLIVGLVPRDPMSSSFIGSILKGLSERAETLRLMTAILLLTYCYIMIAVASRRMVLKKMSAGSVPILAMVAQAVLTLVPVIVGYVVTSGVRMSPGYWLGSMGMLMFDGDVGDLYKQAQLAGLILVGVPLLTLTNIGWWMEQWARFRRYKPVAPVALEAEVVKPQAVEVAMAGAPANVLSDGGAEAPVVVVDEDEGNG